MTEKLLKYSQRSGSKQSWDYFCGKESKYIEKRTWNDQREIPTSIFLSRTIVWQGLTETQLHHHFILHFFVLSAIYSSEYSSSSYHHHLLLPNVNTRAHRRWVAPFPRAFWFFFLFVGTLPGPPQFLNSSFHQKEMFVALCIFSLVGLVSPWYTGKRPTPVPESWQITN